MKYRYALLSPLLLAAAAWSADPVQSGEYILAGTTGEAVEIQSATINFNTDGTVTAKLHGSESRDIDGSGRLIGDRLIYAVREWTDFGVTQTTVVANRTADGGFVGTIYRSRNGVAVESGPLTIKLVSVVLPQGAKP